MGQVVLQCGRAGIHPLHRAVALCGIKGAEVSGEETALDGHDSDDFIWIRTVCDDSSELYGAEAHTKEAGIEPLWRTALKMI